jgi:hypothetical protein
VRALSIRQPWAWLIIHAGKDIENRDWRTTFRGRILVHASKGMTPDEYRDAIDTARAARRGVPEDQRITAPSFATMQRGGFVGTVEIVDCVESSTSPWFFGRYGFVLRNPKPLPFVPYRGALGFFMVPDHVVAGAA